MKAALIVGSAIAYSDTSDPVIGDQEVLIQVTAAGLNAADLMQVAGSYPAPYGTRQDIPGLEFAGTAIAQGDRVPSDFIGQRVMGIAGGACQAELVSVHYSTLLHVPADISLLKAAAIPEAYLTAFDALYLQGGLALGQRVLVSGASGGVGSAAVSLAVQAGAFTYGTSRTAIGRDFITSLGGVGIDPNAIAGCGPFDLVLELVGVRDFQLRLSELRSRGTIVIIGVGDQSKTEVDMRLVMMKRAVIRGSTLRSRPTGEKAELARLFSDRVLSHFSTGTIAPHVFRAYPAIEASQAYLDFASQSKLGKMVLQFRSDD